MQKDNTDNSNSYCIPTGFKCINYTDSNKVTTEFIITENRKGTVYTIPHLLNKETVCLRRWKFMHYIANK